MCAGNGCAMPSGKNRGVMPGTHPPRLGNPPVRRPSSDVVRRRRSGTCRPAPQRTTRGGRPYARSARSRPPSPTHPRRDRPEARRAVKIRAVRRNLDRFRDRRLRCPARQAPSLPRNTGGFGAVDRSPAGMPASTHALSVAISESDEPPTVAELRKPRGGRRMPRRHVSTPRRRDDQRRAPSDVVVREQREGRGLARTMAGRAVGVDDGRDVGGECRRGIRG